jgi:hypothetical protein
MLWKLLLSVIGRGQGNRGAIQFTWVDLACALKQHFWLKLIDRLTIMG